MVARKHANVAGPIVPGTPGHRRSSRLLPDEERQRQYNFERSRLARLAVAPHRVHSLTRTIEHASVVETFALTAIRSRGARTPGVDGITGTGANKNIAAFIWSIEVALATGAFMPLAEREIAKPDGGVRRLNFPILCERAIAMAIAWVLSMLFDSSFVPGVVGCRPGRGPHHALDIAMRLMPDTLWLAKLDFRGFFDNILQPPLLARLERRIGDKKFIGLVARLIQRPAARMAGVRSRGLPQGCPASPILANLSAQPFDEWLSEMQVPFTRYVDDVVVVWPGDRPGLERLVRSIADFLATLGLELAPNKTLIVPAEVGVPLVGHLIQRTTTGVGEVHPHPDRVARFRRWMHERADALALATDQKEIDAIKNKMIARVQGFSGYYRPNRESLQIAVQALYEATQKYPCLGPANPSGFTMG